MFDSIAFLTYIIVTSATPGPNNIMSMSNASTFGLKQTLPFNLGIWAGMLAVVLPCTLLGNALRELLPVIEKPMLFVGAAYMLYLAWGIYTSSSELRTKNTSNSFKSGALLQFINIKFYIYCIISMESYILPHYHGQYLKLFLFALLLASTAFFFSLVWAFGGSLLKILFTKYARITNTILALSMVYCAVDLFI